MKGKQYASTLLVWVVLAPIALQAQGPSDQEIATRVQAYLESFTRSGNFTGAVLVARQNRVMFRRAFGMANYELGVPNSPDTRFHIASVSKPFTAASILQLQERGKLSISDPIARYIPDFPNGDRITLDQLLTHTSGIPNINNLPNYDTFARAPHTLNELIAKFSHLPLDFEPGSNYRYSNSNYNLLALIVEKASGEEYGEYIRKHILNVAQMKDSGHDRDALRLIPLAASGYQPSGKEGYEKAAYLDWSNKTGNGSLYSTIDDLYRFDRVLNTDTILKSTTRQKYFVEGRGNRYGWFNRKRFGHRVMSSNGRSPGFTATLDRFPDDDVAVIVLSNSYAGISQDPIAEAISAIVFNQELPTTPPMQAIPIQQEKLASLAGEYQYGADYFVPNAKFNLTAEFGCLLLQLGDFRTPLVPLSETEFLDRNFFAKVLMTKDDKGNVTGLTYRYDGKDFVARRIGTPTPPTP